MPKISPEMTIRDIHAAMDRGELNDGDDAVQTAITARLKVAHAAYRELRALVPPSSRRTTLRAFPGVAEWLEALADDPEKLAQAQRIVRQMENALGPKHPGRPLFPGNEDAP
jgi:hypothetical protein